MAVSTSGAAADGIRGRIAQEMVRDRRRAPVVDVRRLPKPPARPAPEAQWDEVRGTWVEWAADLGGWVEVDAVAGRPGGDPT